MKVIHALKFLMFAALFVPVVGMAHGGEEQQVVIESDLEGAVQAGEVNLSFRMVDTEREKLLKDEDLEVLYEKKLHMFIFDEALLEFQHVYPEFNQEKNRWVVTTLLPKNGNYRVWVRGTLIVDEATKVGFTTNMKLQVVGGLPSNPTPPILEPVRKGSDGNSVITLSKTTFTAGRMAMITLVMTHQDETPSEITPLLGAKVHVIGVLSDGDALFHATPVEHGGHHDGIHTHHDHGSDPDVFMIHVTFPEPGNYRLWVRYIDGGVLRTIPLAVKVIK